MKFYSTSICLPAHVVTVHGAMHRPRRGVPGPLLRRRLPLWGGGGWNRAWGSCRWLTCWLCSNVNAGESLWMLVNHCECWCIIIILYELRVLFSINKCWFYWCFKFVIVALHCTYMYIYIHVHCLIKKYSNCTSTGFFKKKCWFLKHLRVWGNGEKHNFHRAGKLHAAYM